MGIRDRIRRTKKFNRMLDRKVSPEVRLMFERERGPNIVLTLTLGVAVITAMIACLALVKISVLEAAVDNLGGENYVENIGVLEKFPESTEGITTAIHVIMVAWVGLLGLDVYVGWRSLRRYKELKREVLARVKGEGL